MLISMAIYEAANPGQPYRMVDLPQHTDDCAMRQVKDAQGCIRSLLFHELYWHGDNHDIPRSTKFSTYRLYLQGFDRAVSGAKVWPCRLPNTHKVSSYVGYRVITLRARKALEEREAGCVCRTHCLDIYLDQYYQLRSTMATHTKPPESVHKRPMISSIVQHNSQEFSNFNPTGDSKLICAGRF